MASKTKLTIEVGSEFIKIVDAEIAKKKTVTVHHALSVQTPAGAVEDGMIKDLNAVADTIRTTMTEESMRNDAVTFVLSSSRVATKEVILPLIKKEKIQDMVNANATDYFPVNINDYVLSYTLLETKNTKEDKKMRVLVYAAPEAMVESYYNLAKVLGMKVTAVDYSGNSTLQLIKLQTDAKPNLVVQIGMDTSIVSVMNNNVLQLQRTVPYGESALLNAVMNTKNVKSRVALELLSSARLVKDSLDADEITGSLKHLVNNINRVIEYYAGRNQEAPLQKIVVIGDGADVLGLDGLIANETSLPCERLTMLKNVNSYNRIKVPDTILRQYMTNIGAVLEPIHLTPRAMAGPVKEKSSADSGKYMIACVAMVAVAAILSGIPFAQNLKLKSERSELNDKINEVSDIKTIINDYYAAENKYTDLKTYYLSTANSTEYGYDLLKYLEKKMPTDMYLSAFEIDGGVFTLAGTCNTKSQVAQLQQSLEDNENVIDVSTTSVTVDDEKQIVTFSMNGVVISDVLKAELETGIADGTQTETQTTAAQ